MNKVVVDTNILFSSFLSKNSNIRKILLSDRFLFFSCNSCIAELIVLKDRIKKYTKLKEKELFYFIHEIVQKIEFVNERYISKEAFYKAWQLCKDIDESDTPFVALTIELNALLWTGDKKLKEGLKKKGFNSFFEI
jgi:predicted nucleic acid-binding protein